MNDKNRASSVLGASLKSHRLRSRIIISIAVLVLIGAFLASYYLDRFVFFYADEYFNVALWSTLLLSPFVLFRIKKTSRITQQLGFRYPTAWLRNWIALPLMSALLIGMIFAAPLGWLAAAVAWVGVDVQLIEAKALSVEGYVRGKGCNQYATLKFGAEVKDVCLDGIYPPSSMRAGQILSVGISKFSFGFLILTIEPGRSAKAAVAPSRVTF